jgi:hypothetical protein
MTSAPSHPAAVTFVVVVFEAEHDLLHLQARSFARHVDPAAVAEIIVLDQSRPSMPERTRRRLSRAYGPHATRVRIVTATAAGDGWVGQQVLKLSVAEDVRTSHYVALDAKTHAVGPVDAGTFFGPDGRAHLRWYRYDGHPMQSRVAATAAWLDLPSSVLDGELPATTTPFVFVTDEVRGLLRSVEERAGAPFADAFRDAGLIEFPLYSLWLIQQGRIDARYDRVPTACPTVWRSDRDAAAVRAVLAQADGEPPASFLAVHRSSLARLSPAATWALARWWRDHGLFDALWPAIAFIARARSRIVLAKVRNNARRLVNPAPRTTRGL